MNYTNLGKRGLKVSRICLGCMSYGLEEREWGLDEEQGRPFIKRALELGINFFDTANMYGNGRSEEVVGRALRDFAKRDELVVATKVYFPMRSDVNGRGLSRKAIMTEIDQSLRRLGMRSEERRGGREGRSLCDWSADVCSSDLATKVYFPMRSDVNGRGLSRKAIMTEIDQSLRRLGM